MSKIREFNRPGTIELLASNGEIIQKLGPITRDKMTSEFIPTIIKKAFIASEDRRFYKHNGVDFWSISRAMLTNIKAKSILEGGSTITQQLARIIFLNQEKSISRKLKEIALAYKLERSLAKEEILEQYLNNVYLGSNAYGVSDASWIYFKKTPNQLSLEEAALIAGLAPAPSAYSPLVNVELALKRRSIVLRKMRAENFISNSELLIALNKPLNLQPAMPKYLKSKAPFFTSFVEQELPKILSQEQIEIGGLKIKTSLILDWQLKAREVIKTQSPKNAEGAIISIEPSTGLIRVLVGGKDYSKNQFNRATQALRSPGSTFKIFPYIAAINNGYQPEDRLFDTPRCWHGYCPKNFGNIYYGEVSLSNAFSNSLNTIAVDLLAKVGFKKVISLANQFGVGNVEKLGYYYPLAIGAFEETVLNMSAAYAAIANRGMYIKPSAIEEIRGPKNDLLWEQSIGQGEGRRVISTQVADTMNWMLRKVVSQGSGIAASLGNRQVAGKTGTSENNRDLWFIGSIPQLTTSVWFGSDNNTTIRGSSGDAALAWKQFMRKINSDLELVDFPRRTFN
ncbi:Multimodular transpeptidase-transglycosylase [Prochlorococcus sp. MIT 0602]|nr:Multimodular transpeptidase-transglycosylase [Prochlorococcus sp. MIT 0602]